jgi:hypothetical protein
MPLDQKSIEEHSALHVRCWMAALSTDSQPINPSGVAIDLLHAINGVVTEGGDVTTDHSIGLLVHQLMYLQGDSYGHLAEAYV